MASAIRRPKRQKIFELSGQTPYDGQADNLLREEINMATLNATTENKTLETDQDFSSLHHYTTAEGLKGIVEGGRLHVTNLRFLNDAAEFIWFTHHRFEYVLSQCAPEIANKWGKVWAAKNTMIITEAIIQHFKKRAVMYAMSFCPPNTKDDCDGLLSQWRGYGSDGGYALVFDAAKLAERIEVEKNHAPNKYRYLGLSHIKYFDLAPNGSATSDPPSVNELDAVSNLLNAYFKEKVEGVVDNDLWGRGLYLLAYLSAICKHPGFKEEREVRLVCRVNEEVNEINTRAINFRNKNGLLIPYVSLFNSGSEAEYQSLPITKVIVGPHRDSERRARSVGMLLEQNGIRAEVVCSKIPYFSMETK